jgi:phosphatidate cytidylyltransferase
MNNLTLRILSAIVLAPIVLFLTFKAPSEWFLGFLTVVFFIGLFEFFHLNKTTFINKITTIFFSGLFFTTIYFSLITPLLAIIIIIIPLLFWFKNTYFVVNYPNKKPNTNGLFGFFIPVVLFSPLFFLWFLNNFGEKSIILLLFLIVWGADSFAYIFGKLFGKNKLAPNLSGGKTIEGVVGGVLSSGILAYIWMIYNDVDNYFYILLAIITALFSVVGDLYQSIYKREAGADDSGNIIPGHGGVWDRIDGLVAAIPVFVFGLLFIL